jgi:hypothetical protein
MTASQDRELSQSLLADPALPVAVSRAMGLEDMLLQLALGLADEAAVALQSGVAPAEKETLLTKTLPVALSAGSSCNCFA